MTTLPHMRSAEAVERSAAAITALDHDIRAFVAVDLDAARRSAQAVDGQSPSPPLAGVTLGVKDVIDAHGLPTSMGFAPYRDHRPVRDAAIVARLRAAGAVIIGKTASAELAYFDPPETANPAAPGHTPGGSSSGSAAGVAAGMVTAALATQTGGSIIRPASFCGVVGLKPTHGAVSTSGVLALAHSLDTVGVIGRDVATVAAVAQAATGDTARPAPSRPPRVGILPFPRQERLQAPVHEAVQRTLTSARVAGAMIVRLDVPDHWQDVPALHATVMEREAADNLEAERRQHLGQLGAAISAMLARGAAIRREDYRAALDCTAELRREVDALFDEVDVILSPATLGPAPPGLRSTGDPALCLPWSLLHHPAVAVPVPAPGLPIAVQLTGPRWADATLMTWAAWLEDLHRR